MIPVYPIYRRIASGTHARLTPEIHRLSEEIMLRINKTQTFRKTIKNKRVV